MDTLFRDLPSLLSALWWPFSRFMAALSLSPFVGGIQGSGTIPVRVRLLTALVLAVVTLPGIHTAYKIDPFSLQGVLVTFEQIAIGGFFGLAFHLILAVITTMGYLAASQMGLAMATMNDPINGTPSDVISNLLSLVFMLIFFSIDGHLVLTRIIYASFQHWPIGGGLDFFSLEVFVYSVAWIFSAAFLLMLPVIASTMIVQVGFGFLNRVAPTLNLYSLGFSVITLFGLLMLSLLVPTLSEHYIEMTHRILDMLNQSLVVTD